MWYLFWRITASKEIGKVGNNKEIIILDVQIENRKKSSYDIIETFGENNEKWNENVEGLAKTTTTKNY